MVRTTTWAIYLWHIKIVKSNWTKKLETQLAWMWVVERENKLMHTKYEWPCRMLVHFCQQNGGSHASCFWGLEWWNSKWHISVDYMEAKDTAFVLLFSLLYLLSQEHLLLYQAHFPSVFLSSAGSCDSWRGLNWKQLCHMTHIQLLQLQFHLIKLKRKGKMVYRELGTYMARELRKRRRKRMWR